MPETPKSDNLALLIDGLKAHGADLQACLENDALPPDVLMEEIGGFSAWVGSMLEATRIAEDALCTQSSHL